MNKYKRILHTSMATLMALALLSGCTEPPEACYLVRDQLVDTNEDVTFDNCTEPLAESYSWDFGDGTTSSAVSPVHRFTAEGQYLVSLTANGKTRSSDNVFKTLITAGQRILALMNITNLPSQNPNGDDWDIDDNPDLAVRFSKGATIAYQSPTRMDAALTFPIPVQMPSTDLVLTPEAWTIQVLDIDGGSEEVIASFPVDFETVVPTGLRSLQLTAANGAAVHISYTLRQ
ncbi:MAG TPA: PKD domain-containing protein [Bacteroidia bacterium]|nr:PKD domain-containing protein [Bacteroidia bacterium]